MVTHAMSNRTSIALAVGLMSLVGCKSDIDVDAPSMQEGEAVPADYGTWLSLDTAPDGLRLVMSYYDKERGGLGFATGTIDASGAPTWVHERVDGYPDSEGVDRGDRGKYADMKVAADGTVWIAYQDVTNGVLYAAQRNGPFTWEITQVDPGAGSSPSTGEWSALDFDEAGNPIVVHHDSGSGTLRRSAFEAGSWTNSEIWAGESWEGTAEDGTVLSRPANVGQFARLMIIQGTEYITFYDAATQKLNLLEGSPGAYVHTVVTNDQVLADHTSDNMGQWPSMLLDGSDLHIAFHDVTNQNLMTATRIGGAAWQYDVVDSAPFRGADTEIFKHNGELAVVYFDGYANDMMVATQSGAVWTPDILGGEDGALGFYNEATRVGETWWVGSYDYTNKAPFIRTLE
jgi:hypothetical protein